MLKKNIILTFIIAILLFSILITLITPVLALGVNQTNQTNQTQENETIYESLTIVLIRPTELLSMNGTDAFDCLVESQQIIQELVDDGFNVVRPNDLFMVTNQLFNAEVALDKEKGTADYSRVLERCEEISNIQVLAYDSYDQLNVLSTELEKSTERLNISEAQVLFDKATEAFYDERYENCLDLIDQTYNKLYEIESSSTIFNTFYSATKRTLATIFIKNWLPLSIFILAVLISYLLFNKQVKIHLLKRKRRFIKLKKEALLKLIEKVQKDYFERNLLSETAYHIKLKKFGEMVRDANRQIPLIEFELTKLRRQAKEGPRIKKKKAGRIREEKSCL
ncbi:MAG: hypothetical protein GPJ50_11010, partial [Candidatus Heimdallarchaeota archaeon]|nr:hypothetical protein [Candidatus Heimdallarchaeota archaeon]